MTDEELEQRIRELERGRREGDALPELDAPLGDDVLRSIVDRFSDEPDTSESEAPEPANRAWIGVGIAVLAAALVLAFLVVPSGSPGPVPTYALTGQTGISDVRSAGGELIAAPGKPVRLILRPSTRTDRVPVVSARLGDLPVATTPELQPGGAVVVTLGMLPPGEHVVDVRVALEGADAQDFQIEVESRR